MFRRRMLLLTLTTTLAALGVVVVPVIAEELFGVITKVDVANQKLTVVEKESDKEIEVTTTENTEFITRKGTSKLDLEKLSKNLAKAQEAGKKGIPVKVVHEKGVASTISPAGKKAAPKPAN